MSSSKANALSDRSRLGDLGAVLAVSLGFVMAMLDVTVVNVALAAIRKDLQPTLPALVWIVDAYTLTFAALLLLGGAVADRIGAKRTYMLGLVWFCAASALCALSGAPWVLIMARLLQGVGAALFMPSSLSLLTETFPNPERRARMLSIWAGLVGLATGAGPFVGGLLVTTVGWRSIFFLNLPLGALGLLLASRALAPSPRKPHTLDLPTHLLLTIGLAGLAGALIEGPDRGWASAVVVGAAALAAFALALVIRRELKAAYPAIPSTLARNGAFWRLNGLGFLVNFVVFGEVFLLSLYLQQGDGRSALMTGLIMLPVMGVVPIANYASGWGILHWGRRCTLLIGLGVGFAGLVPAAVLTAISSPLWSTVGTVALCNTGVGFAIPAMISGVMDHAGETDANLGSALLNANRQVGALAGVAGMGALLQMMSGWPQRMGFGLGLFAVALAVGGLLVLRHRDANPEATPARFAGHSDLDCSCASVQSIRETRSSREGSHDLP